jgi:hypothetical protein
MKTTAQSTSPRLMPLYLPSEKGQAPHGLNIDHSSRSKHVNDLHVLEVAVIDQQEGRL